MHLHLDVIGGIAGDMFAAALTDAFPHLRAGMLDAVRAAGLPAEIGCGFEAHNDGVLSGSRFTVAVPKRMIGDISRAHTLFAEIKSRIHAAPIGAQVKERATDIFRRLAEVEANIHGTTVDEVGFHELGGWDSVADMVGAAYLISELKIQSCTVSKLPLGSGRVKTSHGPLPVPVPAVARLLEGFGFIDDGIPGERITPTGAAILRHLGARQDTRKSGRLSHTGYGFGTKRFPGISNVLRVLVLEETGSGQPDQIARITFEVDDQTPEDLAIGLDRIREVPGVVDVIQLAAFGKKGRMSVQVQVLAQPSYLDAVCEACLKETTTLGVRHEILQRTTLSRSQTTVEAGGNSLRVKLAERPQGTTAKTESDDVRKAAGNRAERDSIRKVASLRALSRGS
ncbi:MAG: LarC family nickel insertion protein [Betaproteobacteria bacterium]|nr:LarC family nickel insertion protein [Betaproteobacteria bacterium]